MHYTFENKTVIITGASSGIGEAVAIHLAKKKCNLVLAARNINELNRVADECKKYSEVYTIKTDVAIEDDCKRLMDGAKQRFKKIDIVICNAGISMRATLQQADISVIKKVMDVNFWGTVFCTKYAIDELLKNNGSLIGISSIAGFKGLPARTGYSASKFAIHGFLESVRIENHKYNLHVGIICPGFTASNIRITALGANGQQQGESPRNEKKMMQPEEVAIQIEKCIVKRKKYSVLTNQGKLTVWLNRLFPSYLDGMVYKTMKKEPGSPF